MLFNPKIYFKERSTEPMIAQLQELTCLTHDTDIHNIEARDELIEYGYIARTDEGWNYLTTEGLTILHAFNQIGLPSPGFIYKPKQSPKKIVLNDQEQLLYNLLPDEFSGIEMRKACSQLKISDTYFYMAFRRKYSKGLIVRVSRGNWKKVAPNP